MHSELNNVDTILIILSVAILALIFTMKLKASRKDKKYKLDLPEGAILYQNGNEVSEDTVNKQLKKKNSNKSLGV